MVKKILGISFGKEGRLPGGEVAIGPEGTVLVAVYSPETDDTLEFDTVLDTGTELPILKRGEVAGRRNFHGAERAPTRPSRGGWFVGSSRTVPKRIFDFIPYRRLWAIFSCVQNKDFSLGDSASQCFCALFSQSHSVCS